jgi:succinate dehydrogenase / fumarate reductase iron-sulfur subunit
VKPLKAQVRVFRLDPGTDATARFDDWEVPYEEGQTVLDVLIYIYEHFDPTLAFRWGCKKGHCGSCPVQVNGHPAFSCRERAAAELVVEPHSKFEVIKDLVVDFEKPKSGR